MDLIAAIQTVVKNQLKGAALTDLSVGTVTGIDPLEVTLQASKPVSYTHLDVYKRQTYERVAGEGLERLAKEALR